MTKSYVNQEKEKYNEAIIASIANNGLYPSVSEPRVYSYDGIHERKNRVCYFEVQGARMRQSTDMMSFFSQQSLMDGAPGEDALTRWQHAKVDGLWSLSLEREFVRTQPNLNASTDLLEWEERLSSTMLIIMDLPKDGLGAEISGMSQNAGSPIIDRETSKPFLKENIIAVIVPEAQLEVCRKHFGADKVFSASSIIRNATCPLHQLNKDHREYMQGPDYASVIRSLVSARKIRYPFAAHITRLATKRDFIKINELYQSLSVAKCFDFYGKSGEQPEVLLRNAAAFGEREDAEYVMKHFDEQLKINDQSPSTGKTALHHAASRGEEGVPMLKSLLLHGANAEIKDKEKCTPKGTASAKGVVIADVISGQYDKNIFIRRARAELSKDPLLSGIAGSAGKHYEPYGLSPT